MNVEEEREKQLLEQWIQSTRRLERMRFCALRTQMSRGEFFLLCRVQKGKEEPGVIRGTTLARETGLKMPAISRTLGALEKKGWIERETDTRDRRNIWIRLTEEGRQQLEAEQERILFFMKQVLGQMGEEDVRVMIGLCHKMADIIEEKLRSEEEEGCKKTENDSKGE